jgi:hypothetical protein
MEFSIIQRVLLSVFEILLSPVESFHFGSFPADGFATSGYDGCATGCCAINLPSIFPALKVAN